VQDVAALQRDAIQKGADIAALQAPSRADLGLDILASTLDAATSIYAYNQLYNQTQINDPLRDFQQAWEVF